MHNRYRQASYRLGAHNLKQLPEDAGAEVAFAGRSNAGKSSAINAICEQKGLARTSKTPGRTQQMVVFDLTDRQRLVDLPGYGYAKVPLRLRQHWQHELNRYFHRRQSLKGLMLMVDIRHLLKDGDWQMLEWAAGNGLPCHVLLTKADKLNNQGRARALARFRQEVDHPLISVQVFSALRRTGLEQARQVLDRWLFPESVDLA